MRYDKDSTTKPLIAFRKNFFLFFISLLWDRGAVLLGECPPETNLLYICGVGKLVCVHAVHVRITLKVQSE